MACSLGKGVHVRSGSDRALRKMLTKHELILDAALVSGIWRRSLGTLSWGVILLELGCPSDSWVCCMVRPRSWAISWLVQTSGRLTHPRA